jgi:hypothetical protein
MGAERSPAEAMKSTTARRRMRKGRRGSVAEKGHGIGGVASPGIR